MGGGEEQRRFRGVSELRRPESKGMGEKNTGENKREVGPMGLSKGNSGQGGGGGVVGGVFLLGGVGFSSTPQLDIVDNLCPGIPVHDGGV